METADQFRIYAAKLLDPDWPGKDIERYLELAVLGWNTAILSKPERIREIERYIQSRDCPHLSLGTERYDTLELVVALAHIKKALFPEVADSVESARWQPEKKRIILP